MNRERRKAPVVNNTFGRFRKNFGMITTKNDFIVVVVA